MKTLIVCGSRYGSTRVIAQWIAEVGLDRSVISRIVQNTKISNMHTLLSQAATWNTSPDITIWTFPIFKTFNFHLTAMLSLARRACRSLTLNCEPLNREPE